MANTLQTTIDFLLTTIFSGSSDLSVLSDRMALDFGATLDSGVLLNQADLVWSDTRTLAGVTSENIDLYGSLLNNYGGPANFARVKALAIRLKTLTAGYKLEYGGAGANTFLLFKDPTDIAIVRAGGWDFKFAPDLTGFVVTAGTGDILKINNPNANPVDYDIAIVGASV